LIAIIRVVNLCGLCGGKGNQPRRAQRNAETLVAASGCAEIVPSTREEGSAPKLTCPTTETTALSSSVLRLGYLDQGDALPAVHVAT
jgi:hypothetical protein